MWISWVRKGAFWEWRTLCLLSHEVGMKLNSDTTGTTGGVGGVDELTMVSSRVGVLTAAALATHDETFAQLTAYLAQRLAGDESDASSTAFSWLDVLEPLDVVDFVEELAATQGRQGENQAAFKAVIRKWRSGAMFVREVQASVDSLAAS